MGRTYPRTRFLPKEIKKDTTRCVSGVDSKECYVADINLRDLDDKVVSFLISSGRNLVLGYVRPKEYDLGNFRFLTAVGAWY